MAIASVSLHPFTQKLADQSWRFATAPIAVVPGVVVGLTNDEGATGLGYARAMPPTGLPQQAMLAIFDYLGETLVGLDETNISGVMDALERRLFDVPMAKAAIECALFDLAAQRQGSPLNRLFGEARIARLAQTRIIPLKSPADMAERAARLIDDGYRFLKVKASGDPALDLARVEAVGRAARGRARMMVDANQTYDARAAIPTIAKMADMGVELVEQPTPANDPRGFEEVCRASPIPIEADESAQSLDAILHLATNKIPASINIRILNLGGIRNAMRAIAICNAAGVACRLGASFGPRLLQAFSAHLAATMPEPLFAHEIAEFVHILDDPFEGIDIENGDLAIPTGVSHGVRWREGFPKA